MELLRASSRVVREEGFAVFKLFAANPELEPRQEVGRILLRNKGALVRWIGAHANVPQAELVLLKLEELEEKASWLA